MTAPAEGKVVEAMKQVQKLNAKELDQRITDELGNPMLGAFKALASALVGKEDNQRINQMVHLMVLAALMQTDVRR